MHNFKESDRYQDLVSFLDHKIFRFNQTNPKIKITNIHVQKDLQSSTIKDDRFCVHVPVLIKYNYEDQLDIAKLMKKFNYESDLDVSSDVKIKNQYSLYEILVVYGRFKIENKSILIQYDEQVDLSYNRWPDIDSIESNIENLDFLNEYYYNLIQKELYQLDNVLPSFEINDDDII